MGGQAFVVGFFPGVLGLPVVWTVTALGKRLAKHLDNQLESPRLIRELTVNGRDAGEEPPAALPVPREIMERFSLKRTVGPGDPELACDFFAHHGALSKQKVKDAMNKGAAWLQRKKNRRRRLRRASTVIKKGDLLELYYDSDLLSLDPPSAVCLADEIHYSLWYKPAGLLTQGTNFGDHCSLLRQAELFFDLKRPVHPIHRLDREASGLVLLAHDGNAAGKLSRLFLSHEIVKGYEVVVVGDLRERGSEGTIDLPLDSKEARTEYRVDSYNETTNATRVNAVIKTGRLHQIRRHFAMIGFPVVGDPRYGKGNKNTEGMKVTAVSLDFRSPFTGTPVTYSLADYTL